MEQIILTIEALAYAALVIFSGVLNSKYYESKRLPFIEKLLMLQIVFAFLAVSFSWTLSGFWSSLSHVLWHLVMITGIVYGVIQLPKLRMQYARQRKVAWLAIGFSAGLEALAILMYVIRLC